MGIKGNSKYAAKGMRTIFRRAMANELIETNPAGEAIDGALPSMPKVKAHWHSNLKMGPGSASRPLCALGARPRNTVDECLGV